MRITIAAIGRMKSGPERDLATRYADRFGKTARSLGLAGPDIVEIAESRGTSSTERKNQEAEWLLAKIPDQSFVVALDENGKSLTSQKFADLITRERDGGQSGFCLVIGGADGHGQALLQRANLVLSVGALTWPHQLVRILLCEQLYRTATILSGHPYHRV